MHHSLYIQVNNDFVCCFVKCIVYSAFKDFIYIARHIWLYHMSHWKECWFKSESKWDHRKVKELEQSICLVLHLGETLLSINTHFRPEIELILLGSIRNRMRMSFFAITFIYLIHELKNSFNSFFWCIVFKGDLELADSWRQAEN